MMSKKEETDYYFALVSNSDVEREAEKICQLRKIGESLAALAEISEKRRLNPRPLLVKQVHN